MKTKVPLASIPVFLALAVIGCGGGGSSDRSSGTTTAKSADAFVGTWEGTYATQSTSPSSTPHGTIRVVIQRNSPTDPGVGVTGTATDAIGGAAIVSGALFDTDAQVSNIVLTYPDGHSDAYTGRPTKAANGHLVGPIYLTQVDIRIPTDLDLAPVGS